MKLLYSTTSPFVRKVRMFIAIANIQNEIELELVNPFVSENLKNTNPLSKIPVLRDGELSIIDSSLICEYLDHKITARGKDSLLRRNFDDYFQVQLLHVEANGIIEAAVANLLENRRSDSEQSEYWIARRYTAIRATIENLNPGKFADHNAPNMGTIALSAGLGYLDFRFADYDWRNWNNALAQWFSPIEKAGWYLDTQAE